MTFGCICSGISAPTVAWKPLGWRAAFYAEIDKFPSAVLAHHYPETPNYGDFTLIEKSEPIDVLIGGTPCQSFSVAGLRGGMADDRGNLALEYLKLADRLRPSWLVWENVPGVFSSTSHDAPNPNPPSPPLERDGTEMETEDEYTAEELHSFNCFLAGLSELGYGFAYRVLDAQFAGVPQRRRRIFVVGYFGDWRCAAAVLFERHSLSGHPPPSRKAGERVAGTIKGGSGSRVWPDPSDGNGGGLVAADVAAPIAHNPYGDHESRESLLVAKCLNAKGGAGRSDGESETFVTHSLCADGFDASEDGTGRGTPLVTSILEAGARCGTKADSRQIFVQNTRDEVRLQGGDGQSAGALSAEPGMKQQPYLRDGMAVRRLTTIECARLQGFPDTYCHIPYRRRKINAELAAYYQRYGLECWQEGEDWYTEVAADGPIYKSYGNSMAVPVVHWIGRRIAEVDAL